MTLVKIAEQGIVIPFQTHCFSIDFCPFWSPVRPLMSKQGSLRYHSVLMIVPNALITSTDLKVDFNNSYIKKKIAVSQKIAGFFLPE